MKWVELVLMILRLALEIWRNREDPERAKLKAAAEATKDLNENKENFNEALKNNDALAISRHFEQLRDRVSKATANRDRPSGQRN